MLIQKDFPWKFEDIVLVPSNESHVIFVATKSLLSPSCYSQKAFRVFPLPLTSEMSPWHCWVRVFHFVCLWFLSSNHGSDTCPHSGAVSSITAEYTLSSTPSVLIFWRSVQCMLGTSGFIFWFSWPFVFFFLSSLSISAILREFLGSACQLILLSASVLLPTYWEFYFNRQIFHFQRL